MSTFKSTTVIQQGSAYELSLAIASGDHGHHLQLLSLVPMARHPEHQVRFQAVLSTAELSTLHEAIGQALQAGVGTAPSAAGPAL